MLHMQDTLGMIGSGSGSGHQCIHLVYLSGILFLNWPGLKYMFHQNTIIVGNWVGIFFLHSLTECLCKTQLHDYTYNTHTWGILRKVFDSRQKQPRAEYAADEIRLKG